MLSQTTADSRAALEKVAQLVENRKDENAIVYLVSDFCERNWQQPEEIKTAILNIERTGAAVEMIDCSQSNATNLAVTGLVARGTVRAAETPLMMELTVKNFSATTARKVQVEIESWEYPNVSGRSQVEDVAPEVTRLPAVFIESIEPGETAKQAFPVFFNSVGQHSVVAKIKNDSLAIDNERSCVVDIKKSSKVLLVESLPATESKTFSFSLTSNSGIETEFVDEAYLRDCTPEQLSEFDTVFLLDVPSVSETGIKTLEQYAADGGGVVFFLGPKTDPTFVTQKLYRDGNGVFPIPLKSVYEVPDRLEQEATDIQPVRHPLFIAVMDVKNSILDIAQIRKIIAPPLEWAERSTDSNVEVLATVRGAKQHPLVVTKTFGSGRCVAVTTTAMSGWSNWSKNPTYPAIILLLQDYVSAGRYSNLDHLVGEPIEESYPKSEFRSDASMVLGEPDERVEIPFSLTPDAKGNTLMSELSTDNSGVYEIWAQLLDGEIDVRRTAINVDTSESDLTQADHKEILNRLSGSQTKLVDWDKFNPDPKIKPASTLNRLLFCLLIATLIVEPLLAYMTNYHR